MKPQNQAEVGLLSTVWKIRGLLAGLLLLVYCNTFALGLALDGAVLVSSDSRIQDASLANLKLIFTRDYWWPSPVAEHYRPITTLTYFFNYSILGNQANPAGYHLLNFLLACASVLLAFEVARHLFRDHRLAFFAAALWGVHPVATDVVPNIVGRADLLAAISLFACLLLHQKPVRRWTMAAFFAIALAGDLSKETALLLPALLLLFDALDPRPWSAKLRLKLPYYVASIAAAICLLVARQAVLQQRPWPIPPNFDNPIANAGFWTGRLTAIKVLGLDLWLMVFPWNLSSDRSYNQIPLSTWSDPWAWISVGAILLITVAAIAVRRKQPLLLWAAAFAAITLLPTANLLVPIGSIHGERFLYLPAFAFAVAATVLIFRATGGRRMAMPLLGLLTLLFGARTFARNFDWQDNATLMSHDITSAPGSFKTHDILARALCQADPRRYIERCIQEGETAARILDSLPLEQQFDQTLTHLGLYYSLKGDLLGGPSAEAARSWYEKSVVVLLRAKAVATAVQKTFLRDQKIHGRPHPMRVEFQPLFRDLATAYRRLGRNAEAVEEYRAGLTVKPEALDDYPEMANTFLALGRPDQAASAWLERMLIEGLNAGTMSSLAAVFAKIPGAECAIVSDRGFKRLNPGCPAFHSAVCQAAADVEKSYQSAFQPEKARDVRDRAAREYGCP